MKVSQNLVSENKPIKENQTSLPSIPTRSEPYYEPMDFFNSAEEAKQANEKSGGLEFPMDFYATAKAAKKAVDQHGLFVEDPTPQGLPIFEDEENLPYEDEEPKGWFDYAVMPEAKKASDIIRNNVSVTKNTAVAEESDEISKTIVGSLKKQIQQKASENEVKATPHKRNGLRN